MPLKTLYLLKRNRMEISEGILKDKSQEEFPGEILQ